MSNLVLNAAPLVTESEIDALVDAFHFRVQRDALIGPVFNEAVED